LVAKKTFEEHRREIKLKSLIIRMINKNL
jgi:hypothetical protein